MRTTAPGATGVLARTLGEADERDDVLRAEHVTLDFRRSRRDPVFRALDDVSLVVPRARTVGIVGESGSGKSTFARAALGLLRVDSGSVTVAGHDVSTARRPDRRALARHVQAVFQDPGGSLNPSYPIARSLAEPLLAQGRRGRDEVRVAVGQGLERVGLDASAADRLPRHFSGGQRQRICIARALMVQPELLVCDEAVSALDLSVQAQVLNLLMDLQDQAGLAYLFISHDMNVVRRMCHEVTVLHRGRVMETGPVAQVTSTPAHPYTRALLLASPVAHPVTQAARREGMGLGRVNVGPAPANASDGCPFASRCPVVRDVCRTTRPVLRPIGAGVSVACHRYPAWKDEVPPMLSTHQETTS